MSTQLENSVFMVFYVKIEICMDQGQTVKGKVGTVSFLSFTGSTMVKLQNTLLPLFTNHFWDKLCQRTINVHIKH